MRSALRLLLVAIGSCAYAGLAVLDWGGFLSFFSHPAFVALVVVLLALSVLPLSRAEVLAPACVRRGNRWVIPVLVIICAGRPIQRLGRDPAGPHSGDQWCLPSHPSPQLSWPAYELTGMEP